MSVDFPPNEATKAALRRLLGARGYDAYFREEIAALVRQGLGRVVPLDDGEALPPGSRQPYAPEEKPRPEPEEIQPPIEVPPELRERTARELAEERRALEEGLDDSPPPRPLGPGLGPLSRMTRERSF